MLVASLALHGLAFAMPLPSPSEAEAEATEPEEEEIVDLAALAAAQTQASPSLSPIPSPQAALPTLPPIAIPTPAATLPPAMPQPVPIAVPSATPMPEVQATPRPTPQVSVATPAPALGLSSEQIQALQAALRQRSESSAQTPTERAALAVPVTCPALTDYQSDFCNGEQWKQGIFYQQTRSNENADEALTAFQEIFSDYNFTEDSPYAEAPLYELKSKTDPNYPTFYLSLVQPSRIGRTTIGIVWAVDPNQPSTIQTGSTLP